MLLMAEKGIRGGICRAIHRYAKRNNKYMKNYIISSYLMHFYASNLYGRAMSQKLPVNGFKCVKKLSKFNKRFIKDSDENSDKGYFLEVDVKYPKSLFNGVALNIYLKEIRNKIKKCNKFVCNIKDKENDVIHIRALKQALNHGLILKKVNRVIQFNQEARLKPYIDMNTKLRTEAKN